MEPELRDGVDPKLKSKSYNLNMDLNLELDLPDYVGWDIDELQPEMEWAIN